MHDQVKCLLLHILGPALRFSLLYCHQSFCRAMALNFEHKVLTAQTLPYWRESLRQQGRKVVVTNGCFDLLHVGHVTYLQQARNLGDALLVGLNSDVSISQLKGPSRPVCCEHDRCCVLAALESVSGVFIFAERDACRFLELSRPDVYVKGGDYTVETLNQEERRLLESMGAKILILPVVAGKSTTAMIEKSKVK